MSDVQFWVCLLAEGCSEGGCFAYFDLLIYADWCGAYICRGSCFYGMRFVVADGDLVALCLCRLLALV